MKGEEGVKWGLQGRTNPYSIFQGVPPPGSTPTLMTLRTTSIWSECCWKLIGCCNAALPDGIPTMVFFRNALYLTR